MHPTSALSEILILLATAVVVVAIFRRLNLSPVLGYLAAGLAIGPYGFKLIPEIGATAVFAEFGVVFLLFIIGLELSFSRLRAMRFHVFGFGTAQVLITGLLIGWFMLRMGYSHEIAIIVGGGLALSSTAIVLQVVAESGAKASQTGRLSLAVLLLQDLAVVPLLVLVPLLARDDKSILGALGMAGIKAAVALVLIFIAGRLLLKPLFRFVASFRNAEMFVATTLLVLLGTSWATYEAGLSLALGAFMAGLLVAETEYKHQVEADILPYKSLLLGLFFMVVGMSVNWRLVVLHYDMVLTFSLLLIMTKAMVVYILSRLDRFDMGTALHTGLLLSQGGEFAFVLFRLAGEQNVMSDSLGQILLVTVAVTMALTPIAASLGQRFARKLARNKPAAQPLEQCEQESLDLAGHVVVAGFGRVGQTIAKLLAAEDINYVAVDIDPAIVNSARKRGMPVAYGDVARREVLEALGIGRARAVIITVNDFLAAERAVCALRAAAPELPIVARTSDRGQLIKLEAAGANIAVSEMYEGSLQLGSALMKVLGVADQEIGRIVELFRAQDYALTYSDAPQIKTRQEGLMTSRISVSLLQKINIQQLMKEKGVIPSPKKPR